MARNSAFIIVLLLLASTVSMGAVNRYMVFFNDKANNGYSLNQPDKYLSAKAIERRTQQSIEIVESDLPVNKEYLNRLSTLENVMVFFPSKWVNGVLVEAEEASVNDIKALSFVKEVVYVAPGKRLKPNGGARNQSTEERVITPNSIEFESQPQNEFIGVEEMHQAGYKGEGMLIAIFDSGFDDIDQSSYFNHLFHENKITGTRDFIRNSGQVFQYDAHGSKVLSLISAYKEGVFSGTAPKADIVLCVTEDIATEYRVEEYNWLFAAEYADSIGADVINSSVGYATFDDDRMDYKYSQLDGNTTVITLASDMASSKGIIVVASVGNEGNNSWKFLTAPADADSILAVGSVTHDKIKSGFSSIGPTADNRIKPDVSSLGTSVKVVYREQIGKANGTSFSSPMIAGLAAGLWQAFPDLTNMEIIQYLKMSATQASRPDTLIGYGIPNFTKAYNLANINEGGFDEKFVVFPNPVSHTKTIYLYSNNLSESGQAILNFYDLKGSEISSRILPYSGSVDFLEIDVSFLSSGTYLLTYSKGSDVQKYKLIIL